MDIKPIFKVGDMLRIKDNHNETRKVISLITMGGLYSGYWDNPKETTEVRVSNNSYILETQSGIWVCTSFKYQDDYELVSSSNEQPTKEKVKESVKDPIRLFFGEPKDYKINSEGMIINPMTGEAKGFL